MRINTGDSSVHAAYRLLPIIIDVANETVLEAQPIFKGLEPALMGFHREAVYPEEGVKTRNPLNAVLISTLLSRLTPTQIKQIAIQDDDVIRDAFVDAVNILMSGRTVNVLRKLTGDALRISGALQEAMNFATNMLLAEYQIYHQGIADGIQIANNVNERILTPK